MSINKMQDASIINGRSKKSLEIINKKFGLITITKYLGRRLKGKLKTGKIVWVSVVEGICDCGVIKKYDTWVITSGQVKSCGCVSYMVGSEKRVKHGCARRGLDTPEYTTWLAMTQRCYTDTIPEYKNYGGRGIKVCGRWRGIHGFENFLSDIGLRPTNRHSLDRFPDVNGDYEPSNCRWATKEEQANNTRRNKFYFIDGVRITQAQGMRKYGIRSTYQFHKKYQIFEIKKQ